MSLRFFRPWEDGGQGNTCQTADKCQKTPSENSKTTLSSQVLSVQAEQRDVTSEATWSAQVLPDIPGASYPEEEAHRTEEGVRHESQLDTLSMENSKVSQDRVLRQTSAIGSRENPGRTNGVSICTYQKADNHACQNVNHIQKSSSQTDKHSSKAHKIPPNIMSSQLTTLVASQNNPSLQVTWANASVISGDNLYNLHSLPHSGSFATENNLHNKDTPDMTANVSKAMSEMDHGKVVRHSSITKQERQSRSTSMKDECCAGALSDGNSAGRQKHCQAKSKSFQCKTCGKSFLQSSSMHRHGKTHLELRPFQCTFCEKTFSRLHNLHVHQRIHTGIKPFKCSVCEKAFKDSGHLHRHKRIHTRSTPFKCRDCAKAFKESSALHVHERIHTGSMPYKCLVCEKAFKQSGDLHKHERIHTGSKPFKCTVCEKAFAEKSNMHRHERIHTGSKPFNSSVCIKAFTQSCSGSVHGRIYTGCKQFKCSICEKAFKKYGDFRVHKRIHIESRPLK